VNPRFHELSRKAAAGTLNLSERDELDTELRRHPERFIELEWDTAFAAQLERKIDQMPAMPGWEHTHRALQAEAAAEAHAGTAPGASAATALGAPAGSVSAARSAPGPQARGPGVLDRLSGWISSSFGFAFNAQALALALVLVQAGVIGLLAWQVADTGHEALRGGPQDATPRGALLRVSFRDDVREGDLRRALSDAGAEIVGGPGQIGVYLVRVRDGELEAAAQRLRDSGTTTLVEAVPAAR
jgi:hypothetical protein